jgi:hypothetical protein
MFKKVKEELTAWRVDMNGKTLVALLIRNNAQESDTNLPSRETASYAYPHHEGQT